MNADYLEKFTTGYKAALLWSENDNATEQGGEPISENYDFDDLDEDSQKQIAEDCEDFVKAQWELLKELDPEQCGHDFALTRNGHGAGYFDRGLGKTGERLTAACEPYGSQNLMVADDGSIFVY